MYVLRLIKRSIYQRQGEQCKLTQAEANELMSGNKLDMANSIANTANMFLVCMFYTPLIPWAPFACIIGLGMSYLVEKYLLLRRYSRPEEMSATSIHFVANIIPYMILLWALSNLLFARSNIKFYKKYKFYYFNVGKVYDDIGDKEVASVEIIALIAIGIVGLYILFPVRTIIQRLFSDNKEDEL